MKNTIAVRVAVTGILGLAAGNALAQNSPYQSERRVNYGTGFGQEELPLGVYLEPRVDGALQYADNVNLSSTDAKSAVGIEAAPGIYASYKSDRFTGVADYSLIGRFWDDSDLNDIAHRLDANGRWIAIHDLLSIDAEAAYGDSIIDFGQGANYGDVGVFKTSNLREQASASITPTLEKRFKDFLFRASYTYGRVWLLDQGKGQSGNLLFADNSDSEDQDASISIGLAPDSSRLDARVFYSWTHSEYDRSLPYEFERAGFDGGWELTRTLSVIGDVGKESDLDASTSAGGLDSDFWSAGLKWAPNARTSVQGKYGERFFGESYSVLANHTARLLEFTASYEEAPGVRTQRLNSSIFDPGNLPPNIDPGTDYSRFNSQPYLGKDGRIGVSAKGRRTKIRFDAFYSDRNYVNALVGDEEGNGFSMTATRDITSDVSVDFESRYTDYQRDASLIDPLNPLTASHDYDTEIMVRGNRDFGPRLLASLEAGYFNRGGTVDYVGWWVGLRGRWIPDFSR